MLIAIGGGKRDEPPWYAGIPPLIFLFCVIFFPVIIFFKKWQTVFWTSILLSGSSLGCLSQFVIPEIAATVAAYWARGVVEARITEVRNKHQSDLPLTKDDFPLPSGWGWKTYSISYKSGDSLFIWDDYRNSGWGYNIRTGEWDRINCSSFIYEEIFFHWPGILFSGLFIGGLAGARWAHQKTVSREGRAGRQE